jgi:hypothetical protein
VTETVFYLTPDHIETIAGHLILAWRTVNVTAEHFNLALRTVNVTAEHFNLAWRTVNVTGEHLNLALRTVKVLAHRKRDRVWDQKWPQEGRITYREKTNSSKSFEFRAGDEKTGFVTFW